jgi:hypothetical protein
MFKPILAALLLALAFGALCPAPAAATSTPRTESSFGHRRRYRRHRRDTVVIRLPGYSN